MCRAEEESWLFVYIFIITVFPMFISHVYIEYTIYA